jgi:DNA-binding CsgD family transcriptional regulator
MGDLPKKTRAAIDAFRSSGSLRPDELRALALDVLREHTDSSVAGWYTMGLVRGAPRPTRWMVEGSSDLVIARQLHEDIPWPITHADPRRPRPTWQGRFVPLRAVFPEPARDLWPTLIFERCWAPAGMHDQLRMLVYDGQRFAAWIGLMRRTGEPPFGRAALRRLAPLTRPLRDALLSAARTDASAGPEEGADLLLTPSGEVALASDSAARWLDGGERRGRLRRLARHLSGDATEPPLYLDGCELHWNRLHGPRGTHYLLHVRLPDPVPRDPMAGLTGAQRQIAELAASGLSAPEIGQLLGRSAATVRAHLRAIYSRMGISTRAELATQIG